MKTAQSMKPKEQEGVVNPPASSELSYEAVLRIVGSWPLTRRTALAQDILTMPTDQAEIANAGGMLWLNYGVFSRLMSLHHPTSR